MPYRMQWVPAPTDENLVVHEEKPQGVYHKCFACGGWIEGRANRFQEDSIGGPLSGRKGTVEHCRRCGQEINFFGMRS